MEFLGDRDEDDTSYDYLASMTADQRDEVISTVRYVDTPKCFTFIADVIDHNVIGDVLNYSRFYEALSARAKQSLHNPINFRTGDVVGQGDLATYYCVWLYRDIVSVHDDIQQALELVLVDAPIIEEENDLVLNAYQITSQQWLHISQILSNDSWREADTTDLQGYPQLWADLNEIDLSDKLVNRILSVYGPTRSVSSPSLVSRAEDGPHNDENYHLYWFRHPNEFGYPSSAVIVGSATNDCYQHNRTYSSCYIDPLLTHSKAYYGALARDCKELDEWMDVEEFPTAYLAECDRFFDDGEYTLDDVEWVNVDELAATQEVHLKVRHLFSENCRRYFAQDVLLK